MMMLAHLPSPGEISDVNYDSFSQRQLGSGVVFREVVEAVD